MNIPLTYRCPLCTWTHEVKHLAPGLDENTLAGVFGKGVMLAIARNDRAEAAERALQAHFATHSTVEWVRRVTDLEHEGALLRAQLDALSAASLEDAAWDEALMAAGVPHEPLQVYTSNSWRRVGLVRQYKTVLEPVTQRDGHPDLCGLDTLAAMVAAFNAMLKRRPPR